MRLDIGIGDIVTFHKSIAGFERKVTGRVIRGPNEYGGKIHWAVEISKPRHQVFTLLESEIIGIVKKKKGNLSSLLEQAIQDSRKKTMYVEVGSMVTVRNLETEEIKEYQIVEAGLSSPNSKMVGEDKPLAQALLGCLIGDVVTLHDIEREIVGIVPPPSKQEIVEQIEVEKISNVFERDFGEKNEFIKSSPEIRSLVKAGPGTGKSFALVHKVACLIEKHKVSPSNILVLSFSREAVAEVKRRLSWFQDERISFVSPVTLDSFASSLLVHYAPNRNWMDKGYDDNIVESTKYIGEYLQREITHIFIDEMQDIVGVRAKFVLELIKAIPLNCGLSMLGDFNQAVYDWTLGTNDDTEEKIDSNQLQTILSSSNVFNHKIAFKNQFRRQVESELAKNVESLIAGIEQGVTSPEVVISNWKALLDLIPRVELEGSVKYEGESTLSPDRHLKKALLVRTNGQIIAEQEEAIKGKFSLRLLGKYNKGLLPAWFAKVLYDVRQKNPVMDFLEFKKQFELIENNEGWESDEAFQLMKFVEKDKFSSYLDLKKLKKNLKSIKDIPLSSLEREKIEVCGLTLATVHCSKGLEFDSVVMVEPEFSRIKSQAELVEALKLFYVGLTRTKDKIFLINSKKIAQYHCLTEEDWQERSSRWFKVRDGSLKFNVDLEDDVEGHSFIASYDFNSVDQVQYHLQTYIKPGHQVEIRKQRSPSGDLRYFIHCNGLVLGCMSLSFFNSMKFLEQRTGIAINRIQAEVGKVYSEYRFDPFYAQGLDQEFTNNAEVWLAIKLKSLAVA